jgi:hypothetical protein
MEVLARGRFLLYKGCTPKVWKTKIEYKIKKN